MLADQHADVTRKSDANHPQYSWCHDHELGDVQLPLEAATVSARKERGSGRKN